MALPDIDSMWDYQDPRATEQRFREHLPAARESGDEAYVAELITQIARAVCLQRQFDAAHRLLDDAEQLLVDGSPARPQIRYWLERGRIYNDTSRTEDAWDVFEKAWQLAERVDERVLAADALHMLGYVTTGRESLRWHARAIEYCQQSEGERFRRWLNTLYLNSADKHEGLGELDEAIECVRRSLVIAEELDLAERRNGGHTFLARLFRLQGDIPAALEQLELVFRDENPRGFAYEERAECLLELGKAEEARADFATAYERLSQDPWYPPTATQRLDRIKRLGGV